MADGSRDNLPLGVAPLEGGEAFDLEQSAAAGADETAACGPLPELGSSRQLAEQIIELRYTDPTTGLLNRRAFVEVLRVALAQIVAGSPGPGLIGLDLDDFGALNEVLGTGAGDRILQTTSERLIAALCEHETVARTGADEFMVLLPEAGDQHGLDRRAAELLEAIGRPVRIDHEEVSVGASAGGALLPAGVHDACDLMQCAEAALGVAQAAGGARYARFRAEQAGRRRQLVGLKQDLTRALEREEFCLVYQAQIELTSGRLAGVEALIRWKRNHGSLVAPDAFIPLSEESGLIVPIGAWVVREAVAQASRWREQYGWSPSISINLSARQLQDPSLPAQIESALEDACLPPSTVLFELTETAVMHDPDLARSISEALIELGCRLALDDFGTGQSSLAMLQHLPFHELKIDRRFITDATTDERSEHLLRAIVALANALDLCTVGEGVETPEQVDLLRSAGCQRGQGYLYGQPMSADAFAAAWLEPGAACACPPALDRSAA